MISDEEKSWQEISVPRGYGKETLYFLSEPAASLSAIVAGRAYTLRAPDLDDVHFFRYYRARTSLVGGQSELLYHAIGYVSPLGKMTLEIDPRGNCQFRFEPVLP